MTMNPIKLERITKGIRLKDLFGRMKSLAVSYPKVRVVPHRQCVEFQLNIAYLFWRASTIHNNATHSLIHIRQSLPRRNLLLRSQKMTKNQNQKVVHF